MKVLLIQPQGVESFWMFPWMTREGFGRRKCISTPLGVATIAALTPKDWEIEIVDEHFQEVPYYTDADIVAISGSNTQFPRQVRWLQHFRDQGKYTVAGGPYASLLPENYKGLADTLISGEAEYLWPQFCAEWPNPGSYYRQVGTVHLQDTPTPRYDLIDMDRYLYAGIQFSRGCPYQCEFCDAIVIFGRKPRVKPLIQIEAELDAIVKSGAKAAFFVDDNLIGNRPKAKELLHFLINYQRKLSHPLTFGCEMTLNVAQDTETLALMREARFEWAFIGIESADIASLKGVKKTQNTKMDPLEAVRTIYQHGIQIYAGFIVGFDEDTTDVFRKQREFINQAGIQVAMISPLFAAPKTPLWKRVKAEGRLIGDGSCDGLENTSGTNMIPKQMSLRQLMTGHSLLYRQLFEYETIAKRLVNKMTYLQNPVIYNQLGNDFATGKKLLKALRPAQKWVDWSLAQIPESKHAVAMKDWSLALMIRDYVKRNFSHGSDRAQALHL